MTDTISTILSKLKVVATFFGLAGFGVGYVKGAVTVFNGERLFIAPIVSIFEGLMSGINFIMYPWIPVMLLFRLLSRSNKSDKFVHPYYLEWNC